MREVKHTLSKTVVLLIVLTTILSGCKSKPLSFEYIEFATVETKSYAIQTATGEAESVDIPVEHNGFPVTHILDEVFAGYNMKYVAMETITYIYPKAFWNCTYLQTLELGSIEVIGQYAFANCRSLASVTIPASCKRIESGAFSNCEKLSAVYFCGAPEEIDPSVFDEEVTIYGPQNSKVEEYAYENGLSFVVWENTSSQYN